MEDLQEFAEQIFVKALVLDPSERAAYLQSVCGSSPKVRERVENMLKEDDLAGSFLERPLFDRLPLEGTNSKTTSAQGSGTNEETIQRSYTPQFKPGEVLCDRFAVIRFIAKGGMGEVYEVEDRQLQGVHVALKTVLSRYAAEPLMQERFEREVLNARKVVHPNLCPIYDIFHWKRPAGHVTFLTMKLLEGETLTARLARTGPLHAPEASLIIRQVGSGLSAAHNAGILHRDIKAANIILNGIGEEVYACVTDFGLARAAFSDTTALTVDGIIGTPGYLAPELFFGGSPSKASDVFSFGVVVYQLLAGHLPQHSLHPGPDLPVEALTQGIPPLWRQLVRGCLEPSLDRRYKDIPTALQSLAGAPGERVVNPGSSPLLTRRKMIALTATGCAAVAGGAWLERDRLIDWLEPLPSKRFVALLAWPAGESQAVVSTILDSIENRLARAEAYVKDLLVVGARDVPDKGEALSSPDKSESSLGANLVLAASVEQDSSQVHLNLRLLDAMSQRVLRKSILSCPAAAISGLTQEAAERAAVLLRLPRQEVQVSDGEEKRNVPADVFQAYSEAEQLIQEPNHSGLQQAIEKYQHALDLDQHFALGYAKLAMAYIEQFVVTHQPANIDLAQSNASKALLYNPNSAMGLLSQALVFSYFGKTADASSYFAKALKADPGNPDILISMAEGFLNQGKLADAVKVYHDILADRPNYWPAYNNLGVALTREAKYEDAVNAFERAGMAAPRVALPMANLGQTYIQLGRTDDAINALNQSLSRGGSEDAYLGMGDFDFEAGKYAEALKMYSQAGKLDPSYHLIQRNMGDCYTMLGNRAMEKECYRRAVRLLSDSLKTNPQSGLDWANLAFYHAKVGDVAAAESDIENADAHGAKDVDAKFMIVQALAVMGKKQEALNLLLWCMDKGLSPTDVDLAIDLKSLRSDPRYLSRVGKQNRDGKASPS